MTWFRSHLLALYLLCGISHAAAQLLPMPEPESSTWYVWLHNIVQILTWNFSLIVFPHAEFDWRELEVRVEQEAD
jgi:hypothetical protein